MQGVRQGIPGLLLALVVASMVAACASGGTASTTGPRAERPIYALGDRWIRSDGIWEVIRVEPDFYVFSAGPGEEIHLTKDLVVAAQRQYGGLYFEFTPVPQVPWPLIVGRQGSVSGNFRPAPNQEPYGAGLQWSIEAYEEVTVPAGTFQAFRIGYTVVPHEVSNFARRPWWVGTDRPMTKTFRIWYAPDVQRLVKADGDPWATTRFELVAVDPGDAAPLQVEVREPKNQTRLLPKPEPVLSGKVSAGKGVRSVAVTVNGETVVQETAKGEPRRTVVLNASLPLRDGKNIILVTATDAAGTTSQEARTVVYVAPLHLQMPPPGQPLRVGRAHVVLAVPMPPTASDKVVYVSLNGVIVEWFRADPARTHHTKMTLEPGANILRIRGAQEPDEERTIVFDPAAEDAPPTQTAVVSPSGEVEGLAEDKRLQDAQRLASEKKRQEDQRLAEEKRQQEKQRLADKKRGEEETQRLAEERRRREDEQRLADEKRQQDEQRRLAEERRRQEEQQRVATLPPLVFTLSSPRDQARFEHESIGLAGLVSGDRGVSRVAIALNGVEVSREEERTPQRAVALNLPIRLREGQNTLVVTVTGADGTISQEVRTVFYERPAPLTVTMRFPQDQMRVTEAASVAAAVVTSSKGVARVSVTVNGVEAHQQTDKTPQKSMLVTAPVKLQAGVNVVAVSATDAEGSVRQEVRTVHFDLPAPILAPPLAPPPPQHDRWAVVIGVGQYDHPAIPRLRYTVSDAEAIYQTLTGPAGFKKEHVLLLTDRTEKKPTLKNIKWALGTFLARSAKKDDTVLIFFAGHGAPETDPRGLERDGLAKYLIPIDAEAEDLYSSALPMDELQTIFGRIEAERVVAFLDACYSGAAGGRTFSSRRTRSAAIDELFLERLTRSRGRAIITASRTTEVSIELPELGHGIFTYYLVQGLKGAADLNKDGIVSLQELYEYVEQQVTAKSRAVGGNQHPVMKGEMEGVLPLSKVSR